MSQVLRGVHGGVAHHAHHAHHPQLAVEVACDAHAGHHHGSDSSSLCDACPYCALFAHSPALPGLAVTSSVAPQRPFFPVPLVTAAFRPYTVMTPAQPRAPPASS
ncbi:DUF2946 family protein [Paraburkholderia sp. BR10879]|uniref:DUF2946 family protein n=1 Tax=Paraburkholderia sp. BR10879 TaxID=3236990 RepID=UPI00397C7F61